MNVSGWPYYQAYGIVPSVDVHVLRRGSVKSGRQGQPIFQIEAPRSIASISVSAAVADLLYSAVRVENLRITKVT